MTLATSYGDKGRLVCSGVSGKSCLDRMEH